MKNLFALALFVVAGISNSAFSQSTPFVLEEGMKKIIPLKSSMEVVVGQKIYYSAPVHGSVGVGAKAWAEDDGVLKLISTHFSFDDSVRAEMSGGDAAKRTFVFEAVKAGKSKVMMQKIFRGDVTEEHEVEVIVSVKTAETAPVQPLEGTVVEIEDPKKTKKHKKFKAEKGMVQLIPLKSEVTVTTGQKLYYSAGVHSSVGEEVNVALRDRGNLKLIDTHFAYDDSQKAGMSGGDAGTKTFVYEAVRSGTSTIIIREMFRGELRREYKITVTVVDPKD